MLNDFMKISDQNQWGYDFNTPDDDGLDYDYDLIKYKDDLIS